MHDSQRAFDSASFAQTKRALARYLTRAGRRALWFKVLRGAALSAGVACTLLLASALVAGPSLSVLGAVLTWAAILVGATLAAAVGVGSLENLSGPRRARLLQDERPELAARVRSAAELARAPNGSPELVATLARSVTDELGRVPLPEIVPTPPHFRALSSGGLALALAASLTLGFRDDAASGLYAMLHPGSRDEQGSLVGLWVRSLQAHITYPERFSPKETRLADARAIHVPEGAVIELTLVPRLGVERAILQLGEQALPWNARGDGTYTLTLTAEESARMELKAKVGDAWVSDPELRALHVKKDATPVVELLTPLTDQRVEPEQRVPFSYRVRDDQGLDGIDLVVQLGPNRERRTRLATYAPAPAELSDEGSTDVTPAAFGARPGQTLAVWIEARDRDAFGGANVGRSPVRTIRVGDAVEGETPEVEQLRKSRDLAIDALGERLETPLTVATRSRQLARPTRALVSALSSIFEEDAQAGGDPNVTLVRDMTRRLSRLLRDESDAQGREASARVDEKFVAELEDDVLWLSDLLGRAKLNAAQGALDRMAATRARMRKLLDELRESDDPNRRAELMVEIARARAELREIAERLSEAEADVPSDFVNYEALQREAQDHPLEELERALAAGDMDAAERALAELDEHMASLENGLEGGQQAFRSARFSPREQALEQARAELSELSESQQKLAKETERVASRAHGRGAEQRAAEANNERLAAESEALERRTRTLEAKQVQPAVSDAQDNAAQRLRDARDALRQGETGEARAMADRAASDLDALAMEMRLDARMYPGRDGSRMAAAREADKLAREVSRFAEEVEANVPSDSGELSADDRESLRKQAPTQGRLGERAGKLSEAAAEQGTGSMQGGLERAQRAMRAAEKALDRGDLGQARSEQREALERLRQTTEELQAQARASRGGEGGGAEGASEGGSGRSSDGEKVTIPAGAEDARRSQLRRRVLDARRAPTPNAYERSVERYYQEILR